MRGRAWAGARTLGGVLVLGVLVWRLGTGPFLAGVRGLGPGTLLAATAVGAVSTVCSAWRWRVVAAAMGVGLPLPAATAAYYRSQFLNGALPGGVLGDVHRGLRHGVDTGDAARGVRAVVWERTAGQVVQAVLTLAVLLTLPSPVHAAVPVVAAAVAAAVAAVLVVGWAVARYGPPRPARSLRAVAGEVRGLVRRPGTWAPLALTSVVTCAGHTAVFLLAARAAGVDAGLARLLPLALVVLLAAAVPLNVGGWGPREGVAAWVFAAAGLGAGPGAATATAFGVMTLVATLPGAVVLLAGRWRPRAAARPRPVVPPAVVPAAVPATVPATVPGAVWEEGAARG